MNDTPVSELIPQREPIVMIDALQYSGDDKTVTVFCVPESHLFVENGMLREPGIIENIAQSSAARAGYESRGKGKQPPIGFIGEVSKLEIARLPKSGETIFTTVTPLHQVFEVTLIKGVVENENGMIAQCEMKIVIRNSDSIAYDDVNAQ